jgi:hypothetical protein
MTAVLPIMESDCEGVDEGHGRPADFTKLVIPSHRGNIGCRKLP